MKVVASKPFTYRGGNKAVLLLHGFTGNTGDVRMLGRYLQERGYTCHAPLYKGHGLEPKELIHTGPEDWWQDVMGGYHFLKNEGFEEIAVAGVSLGGVFSLKVGAELPVKGVVSMCAPAQGKSIDELYKRVLNYAKGYKKFEGKNEEQISSEMNQFEKTPMHSLKDLQQIIVDTSEKLHLISSPTLVLQGRLDDALYTESATVIYNTVNTEKKQLKWYEQSGHIITLDKEREQVYEDVYTFLNRLNW
ncbi:alpha/beta hydrolase [Ectobacillus panaciterrae]|uniref:alpha/beta hydrolase n=1 Tax=Ectobacillus panaciterrae TaxID=363872 RepID=UPI00041D6CF3|nr:carboxylesterase [Ectobacillus panaciterrae]